PDVGGVIGFCAPALMSVGVPTLLGNWFERKQGTVLGIVYALSGIGGAVFNALMGQVISRFGWRAAYGMEGVITLAALLPFTLFVFRLKPGEGEYPYGMEKADVSKTERKMSLDMGTGLTAGEARATTAFYLMIFANLALTVVSSLLQQISPHVSTLGYDITLSSLVMSAVMAGCAIGNVLLGQLLDRFPTMVILGIYVAFGIAGWLGMALTEEKVLLFASGILLGMAQAVFQVGIPYCVRKIFGGREYSGIYASIAFPASAAAIWTASLGGVIFDMAGSYRPVMFLLFLMYICAGPCIWGALKEGERKDRLYEAFRN
ncbi:MAG: MFS transporter, partial [Clostridiales bacterium]|nr:MFS transporter [Clostridiales bacterium]